MKLADIFSQEQISDLYLTYEREVRTNPTEVHKRLVVSITKLIPQINEATGRDNDPESWAETVEAEFDQVINRKPKRKVYFVCGHGPRPAQCVSHVGIDDLTRLRGLKDHEIHLHLHGAWWKHISPEELHDTLLNLKIGNDTVVTVGL